MEEESSQQHEAEWKGHLSCSSSSRKDRTYPHNPHTCVLISMQSSDVGQWNGLLLTYEATDAFTRIIRSFGRLRKVSLVGSPAGAKQPSLTTYVGCFCLLWNELRHCVNTGNSKVNSVRELKGANAKPTVVVIVEFDTESLKCRS